MRLLSTIKGELAPNKVRHYSGFPPELTGGSDERALMGTPAFLLIEENQGGAFLYRYDTRGECVGDTWHADVQEAKEQATYEYAAGLAEWQIVPAEVRDAVAFGIDLCATRRE